MGDFLLSVRNRCLGCETHFQEEFRQIKVINRTMYRSNNQSIRQQIAGGSRVGALATRQFLFTHFQPEQKHRGPAGDTQPGIPANRNTTSTV